MTVENAATKTHTGPANHLRLRAQRCPNDWVRFENSCYAFLDDVVPWTTAEAYCRILHGDLLEVESEAENDFIAAQIRARAGVEGVWQGVNDLLQEGQWVFNSNGQEVTYTNWASGQPDDFHSHENGEDCVWITASGEWGDLWCEDFYSTPYHPSTVCETEASEAVVVG